jgi:hypothetical protein
VKTLKTDTVDRGRIRPGAYRRLLLGARERRKINSTCECPNAQLRRLMPLSDRLDDSQRENPQRNEPRHRAIVDSFLLRVRRRTALCLMSVRRPISARATILSSSRSTRLAVASPEMIWTDPPYGVDYAAKNAYMNRSDRGNRIQVPIENDKLTGGETAFCLRRR